MWDYISLISLILFAFGVAILAIKTKKSEVVYSNSIDYKKLAEEVAKAVGKEIAAELKEVLKGINFSSRAGLHSSTQINLPEYTGISMDESIIPITIETKPVDINLQNMAKEEKTIDKDLNKSKNRLKSLLKRKKE